MAKRSIAATAKSLTVNFGRLALDAQRVALMEMVRVYERAAQAKKAGKTSKKKAKAGKKRLVKAGRKGSAAVKKRTKTSR